LDQHELKQNFLDNFWYRHSVPILSKFFSVVLEIKQGQMHRHDLSTCMFISYTLCKEHIKMCV